MRILKQIIEVTDEKTYFLPGAAVKPLCVKEQRSNIVLYFISFETDADRNNNGITTPLTIQVVGTGQRRDDIDFDKYLGTVNLRDGALMLHCFYKRAISQDL